MSLRNERQTFVIVDAYCIHIGYTYARDCGYCERYRYYVDSRRIYIQLEFVCDTIDPTEIL